MMSLAWRRARGRPLCRRWVVRTRKNTGDKIAGATSLATPGWAIAAARGNRVKLDDEGVLYRLSDPDVRFPGGGGFFGSGRWPAEGSGAVARSRRVSLRELLLRSERPLLLLRGGRSGADRLSEDSGIELAGRIEELLDGGPPGMGSLDRAGPDRADQL